MHIELSDLFKLVLSVDAAALSEADSARNDVV